MTLKCVVLPAQSLEGFTELREIALDLHGAAPYAPARVEDVAAHMPSPQQDFQMSAPMQRHERTRGQRILRWLAVAACIAVPIGALATYFLFAPLPPPPSGPVVERAVSVGETLRRYWIRMPSATRAPARAVFLLHPSQSSGARMRRLVGSVFEPWADAEGVILVYPDGYDGHFNDCRRVASYAARALDVPDVEFMRAIAADLRGTFGLQGPISALGFSNGGQFALRLALEAPDLVDSVGVVAASLPTEDDSVCAPVAGRPRVLIVAGTDDPISPYAGGRVTLFGFGDRGIVVGADETGEWFAAQHGLVGRHEGRSWSDGTLMARESTWGSSPGRVALITVAGGGHTFPQARYRAARLFGATYSDDQVARTMWEFLRPR